MIECRFIFQSEPGGGTSDVASEKQSVHSVPRVGDSLCFVGDTGQGVRHDVKEVLHYLDRAKGSHEIVVIYGRCK